MVREEDGGCPGIRGAFALSRLTVFMFFSFLRPVAVGDTALYYVCVYKTCLMGDKGERFTFNRS